MNIRQKERISFFFIHAITILSLLTYSVCDEKVKNIYLDEIQYTEVFAVAVAKTINAKIP